MKLSPKFSELDGFCPIEMMLISKIMSFMFIVPKTKGVLHGLKRQSILVPADWKKIQTVLPRSCDEDCLISLALKHWLTDNGLINKQQILLALVNTALQKLTEINPFYSNINIDNE